MKLKILCVLFFFLSGFFIMAQIPEKNDTISEEKLLEIERLKYKQQPGLALAASKIFFSDKRYSISGFGEINSVPLQTGVDRNVGDLELYYTGLYRFATFFGYRLTDKLIWNSEFQIEMMHDRNQEIHHEIIFEAFFDYLLKDYLKVRVGFFPLTIGYVNNNDEPVMFYSVNRADVERLIIPSSWIEFGAMFYGIISENWSYALGITQGLNSENYIDGTWIRQGREIRLEVPEVISINPQINYSGIKNWELSASGYFGNSGRGNVVAMQNGQMHPINAQISLGSAFAKYEKGNLRFVAVGAYGHLSDTDKLFVHSGGSESNGQVLGEEVYGYLFETGYDILPLLKGDRKTKEKETWYYDSKSLKLPVFVRFERLNTHYAFNRNLMTMTNPTVVNDLRIWTAGINLNLKKNLVLKGNYQFVENLSDIAPYPTNHVVEFGLGFIF
ncbi:MAG: porin [Cryomorphaceae bacterium]|nr:porin [Cryomorphaceae bacterium]